LPRSSGLLWLLENDKDIKNWFSAWIKDAIQYQNEALDIMSYFYEKIKPVLNLSCTVDINCGYVCKRETEEEVWKNYGKHLKRIHKVKGLTEEFKEAHRSMIGPK
jgi:predicted small metal-binding protein